MKAILTTGFLALLGLSPVSSQAQLELVAPEAVPTVFTGHLASFEVRFRNPTQKTFSLTLFTRIYQASSATVMPMGEAQPWKRIELLAGQTIVERVTVTLPEVRTATRFQVRWLDEQGASVAESDVLGFPDHLLQPLKGLAEGKPIGVVDPDNQLKPLLKQQGIEFEDLERGDTFDRFAGKLVIVGPFASKNQQPRRISDRVVERAKNGVSIVWILSPMPSEPVVEPLAFSVRFARGTVAVAQGSTIADLSNSPLAQLNLVRYAAMALDSCVLQIPE